MMHAAASGRFFISGPAVAFSTTFERMRTTMAEFLLDTGRSSSGLPHWTVNQHAIVRDYRHIHPWLIHVHEDDHVQLVSSTPVGVFLAKLHSFQVGRLHYMAAKLSRKVGGLLHVKPPFFRWFYEFASSRIGSNPDKYLFSPQFDADSDWKHCRDVLIEIEIYRHAENALLKNLFENLEVDVAAIQSALHCTKNYQMVPSPQPCLTVGSSVVADEARRWFLNGEAIVEAYALLREAETLELLRAGDKISREWYRRRVWAEGQNEPTNPGGRVLYLLLRMQEQGKIRLIPSDQRVLLELALLAPLDPATWSDEELPLSAVHPALRYIQLLGLYATNLARRNSPCALSIGDVDAMFTRFGWPTLTELIRRVRTQEPFGPGIFEMTIASYRNLGFDISGFVRGDDPQLKTRESLRKSMEMREADPGIFALATSRFPFPAVIEYYRDSAWLRDGWNSDSALRHHRLTQSLVGAWMLTGDYEYFKLAAELYTSMLGYVMGWQEHVHREYGSEIELKVPVLSPEDVMRDQFFSEGSALANPSQE